MPKEPLQFRLLSIRRMPGLPRGLPIYRDLVPHLNIIFGPNASGKSSTARTLRDLIWLHTDGQITAHGVAVLAGREWELTVDGRKATSRLNGEDTPITGIPAWEARDRYTLAMHELLAADDEDLARKVVNASTGYDLAAADNALGYWVGGIKTSTNVYRNYINAKEEYSILVKKQEDLVRDQQRLRGRMEEKAVAEQAVVLLSWNRLLLEYVRCKGRLVESNKSLNEMPHVLAQMSGGEQNEWMELNRQLESVARNIDQEEETIARANDQRTKLGFPEGGLEEGITSQLEQKINNWIELDRQIADSKQDLAAVIAQEREALKRLGADVTEMEWEGVSPTGIVLIEEQLQRLHQWISKKTAIEGVITAFARSQSPEKLPSPEKLTSGIQSLLKWLQAARPEEKPHTPVWSTLLLAALGVASVLATLAYGKAGLIGLLLLLIALLIVLYSRKRANGPASELRRSDYEGLGLPAPSSWNDAGVTARLNELSDLLGRSKWDQESERQIRMQQDELASMEAEGARLRKQYDDLAGKIQLLPKLPSGDPHTYDGMFWFVRYAIEWTGYRSERKAGEEKIRVMLDQRDKLIRDTNELFARAMVGPMSDPVAAKTLRLKLVEGEIRWRETGIHIDSSTKNMNRLKGNRTEIQGKVSSLYARLGLETSEEEKLRDLVRQVPAYKQARQQVDQQSALLSAAEGALQDHPLFNIRKEEREFLDITAFESQITELTAQAATIDGIRDEISRINANISYAEGGNSLETSLKKMEDSLADLEVEYDGRLASTTGRLLTDALKKEADERDRPAVFKAADSLFSRITQGRYRLRLRSAERPAFTAYETTEGEGRELDHLSTGTRIQLLLAVRLAFIDSVEEAVSVPIIADELLANSDTHRATAIMDALVEISRQGRQIFYFTSQEEEVSRWEIFLADKTDISRKIIRIGEGENEDYLSALVTPDRRSSSSHLLGTVPDPSGLDHRQYGTLLKKQPFNLLTDNSDRLHIWYLFDDPVIIYHLLRKGLVYWGQLQTYSHAGGDTSEVGQDRLALLAQKVKVLGRYLELYRQGRPWPIDRSVLERSGAVSTTFIDAVTEKLEEVGYDPDQLLTALEKGEVYRFNSRKIDQLRDFLMDEGFISENKILSYEEIWVLLAAFVSWTEMSLDEAQRFVDRVLTEAEVTAQRE